MVDALVVASQVPEAKEGLGAVAQLPSKAVLLYGPAAEKAEEIAKLGVKVYVAKTRSPDQVLAALEKVFEEEKPKIVVGWPTKNNRDVFARLAGSRDLPLATDVQELEFADDGIIYKRGFLSERAIAREKIPYPALVLVNQKVFQPFEGEGQGEVVELPLAEPKVKTVEVKKKELSGINLEEAEIIVGVGRGFKKKEDLQLAFKLAELLGAQVGASRPIAADYKWLPEDAWIGISGKRVAPKLYIAIGISGAPQHMAGVMNAKIIVAINKDKSAPIFKQADYGVVADLYEFLPVLIKVLEERKKKA